jgi:hypothetical protein
MANKNQLRLGLVHWLLIAVLVALSINASFYITYFASRLAAPKAPPNISQAQIAPLRSAMGINRPMREEHNKRFAEYTKLRREWRRSLIETDKLLRELNEAFESSRSDRYIIPL